jgi:hypothetical protein
MSWLKTHETLIIVVLFLMFGVYVVEKIDNRVAARDAAQVAATQQALQTANQSAAQAAQAASQAQAALVAAQTAYAVEEASLKAALAKDEASLAARQKVDSTLPPDALVVRWNQLLPAVSPTITPKSVTPSGIMLTIDGAQKTVAALEEIPTLQDEAKLNAAGLASFKDAYNACLSNSNALGKEVDSAAAVLEATKKADAAELKKAKLVTLKTKLHWFGAGVVTGAVTTIAVIVH